MYIETLKKKQGSKVYKTVLLRESYREDGKVKHRTIANLSKVPDDDLKRIRAAIKSSGKSKKIYTELGRSYEYGASYILREFANKIGLSTMIFSSKTEWRENVLAMITGRIIYQGSKLNLVNTYMDTALWELAGHEFGVRPDVDGDCYHAMDELLKRKDKIERKLSSKHLSNGCVVLYDITNIWLEGDYEDSELAAYGKSKDGRRGYKQVAIGLLTNADGCPVGVEIFKGNISDQTTVLDQIRKLSEKYGIQEAVFVGDRGMLTRARLNEIDSEHYKTITALTHKEVKTVIENEHIQPELFDEMNICEIIDSENEDIRYMLCKSENEAAKERASRENLIKKVEKALTEKAAVRKKREPHKVAASVGRLFERYKIEKFFRWKVGEKGELSWEKKEDKIKEESSLDGCYVIKTDASGIMNKNAVVEAYRGLQHVEQAFRNLKTVALEVRPVYHKSDDRIKAHIFISMLAYYLQWHLMQKLDALFKEDGEGKEKRWSFDIIIKRLKTIMKTEVLIDEIPVRTEITKPDEEQQRILDMLEIKL